MQIKFTLQGQVIKRKDIKLPLLYLGSALNGTSFSYQSSENQMQKKLMQYCSPESADS